MIFNDNLILRKIKQGETGVQGITGVQGETGVQGITGIQGETGLQGVTGVSISPTLYNTVITTPITITNTSDEIEIMSIGVPMSILSEKFTCIFFFSGRHSNKATSGALNFKIVIGDSEGFLITMSSQRSAYTNLHMSFNGMATIIDKNNYTASGHYLFLRSTTAITITGNNSLTPINFSAKDPYSVIKITARWNTASTSNTLTIINGYMTCLI